ncbi:transposase [Polymorphospora rubra]|uniref:transposase n=1 Tax=Polymorphospora rubra TaxID=338584 RepID=UPI0033CC3009
MESGWLTGRASRSLRRDVPRRYPPEFRRKVLDLLKAGRSVAELVRDLEISDQTIYNWRRPQSLDTFRRCEDSTPLQAMRMARPRRRISACGARTFV